MNKENQISYFNLNKDGDSAVVRLLHTSVKTIERTFVHTVNIDGKKRTVKCCGEGCPLCGASKSSAFDRIFIHLIDYSDGAEKVWSRTPVILSQLSELEASWGDLSALVLKITRVGNEFPKYTLMRMPPQTFPPVDKSLVDKNIAYRFYMHRSVEELNRFLSTGVMPPHENKGYVSKEEYFKRMNEGTTTPPTQPTYTPYVVPTQTPYSSASPQSPYPYGQQAPTYAPYQATTTQSFPQQQPSDDPFSGAFTRRV